MAEEITFTRQLFLVEGIENVVQMIDTGHHVLIKIDGIWHVFSIHGALLFACVGLGGDVQFAKEPYGLESQVFTDTEVIFVAFPGKNVRQVCNLMNMSVVRN